MAARLIIAPEVELDLDEAYVWYERHKLGLGERFLTSVDACLQGVCRRPELYAAVHKEYRRALVRRFPYAVFYEVQDDAVTVYCICHTSRDADKWRKRLP
jgi:plasmid stabilization system protein ParE